MTSEQKERADRLYQTALTLLASGTAPVDLSAEPEEIRSEVESRLTAYAAFRPGQLVAGRYQLIECVGHGGMGEVYRARDTVLGTTVALKTILPRLLSDESLLERFRREVSLAQRVTHPNVCRVFDLQTHQNIQVLTMEYLEGETLAARLKREGRLSLEQALPIVRQVASGVDAAHKAGVIHQDLKCLNVMLAPQDGAPERAVIMDFGLARPAFVRSQEPSGTSTGTRQIAGTPAYMAPELLRGANPSVESDIYALGVIQYEMAAGVLPAEGRRAAPPVEERWASVIRRCMEPSPERRFRSAAELIEALSPAERAPRRAFLTFAAVAALIALIAFGLSRAGTIRAWLAGVPEKKHIAVLPFTPIGSGEEQEAFAEGLTETITAKLADLEQFQKAFWVVPSSEIRSRKPGSVEETRKAFGVTLVLTGTVQRQPHGIIVTANLVDARSLKQLLARTIEIPSRSAAALQAIVLGNLSDMMGLSVQNEASRSLMAGQTQNPEAYQLYQQGLGHLRRAEHKDVALAIGLFQEALSRDPRYSLAYARLGEGYMRRSSLTRSPADMQLAELNIRRALQLDPNSSAARAALANVQGATGRHKEALESFQVVLKSDSSNAEALTGLARLYARLGQMDQAERAFLRAIEIRPDYWSAYNNLGSFYAGQAKYDKALRMFEMVAELTPESALGFKNAGGINILLGNYPEAEKALHRANEISPSSEAYSNLSVSATFQGRHKEAVQWLEKAVSMNAGNDGTWRNLGDAYRQVQELSDKAQGAYRMALEIVQKRLSLDPTRPDLLLASALYHAKLQQPAQAASALKQAYKSGPLNASLTFKAAVAQAVLGEREQALGTLEQAVRLGYSREQLAKEPELAALRKDERFIRMLATKQ